MTTTISPAAPVPSVILALHARNREAWDSHDRLDQASIKGESGDGLNLQRGMEAIAREAEALREAIMYQLPTTDEELSILAYHTWATFETDNASTTERERQATDAALQAMFNYLASSGRVDVEKLGIATSATIVRDGCSARAGKVEG